MTDITDSLTDNISSDISGNIPKYTHENNGIYDNPFVKVDHDYGWTDLTPDNTERIIKNITGKDVSVEDQEVAKQKALDRFLAFFDDDNEGLTEENIRKIHPNFPESFYGIIKEASKDKLKIINDKPKHNTNIVKGEFNVSFK